MNIQLLANNSLGAYDDGFKELDSVIRNSCLEHMKRFPEQGYYTMLKKE